MDRNEAKLLLQACRANGEDDALPAFAEALALAARDPELKAWHEAQRAFDAKVAAKLGGIPVPSDLRATILAGRKSAPTPMPKRAALPPFWLAAAAMLAALVVVGGLLLPSWRGSAGGTTMASTDYSAAVLPFLGNDSPSLGMTSPEHEKIVAWLKERNSPTGNLPAAMAQLPSVGCQTYSVQGHTVSLMCFTMSDGKLAHLFVVRRHDLSDPPGDSPQFAKVGSWSTAAWSDGETSYLLATQADPDALKQLL
jgi:hypothetical protein